MVKKAWRGGPELKPEIEIKLQERYEGETDYRDSGVASKIFKKW
ncbi:surface protein A [Erysipelothrix rhusiopathiae SY1027]|nr:hypothetical protein [Erysipelothrix rhusiopathiae]AGN23857.1 surface protein A [Erysipelothrix rhusiopathiae SY1027]